MKKKRKALKLPKIKEIFSSIKTSLILAIVLCAMIFVMDIAITIWVDFFINF